MYIPIRTPKNTPKYCTPKYTYIHAPKKRT